MKSVLRKTHAVLLVLACCMTSYNVSSLAASAAVLNAKKGAEGRGYIFEMSHDDIVAKAKQEKGKMRGFVAHSAETNRVMAAAFKAEYPFVDPQIEEHAGTDTAQAFVTQMKAGMVKGWDSVHLTEDFFNEFLPYLKKFDILGMAQHGVLRIPTQTVDPFNRNIVAVNSGIQVVAFNERMLPQDQVPNQWDEFLKPEFKGRKFIADIRPTEVAALVPAWGLERTLEFARKIAAQQPIWIRGGSRILTAMAAGEYTLFLGPNFNTVMRIKMKDPTKSLNYKMVEPIPTRALTEPLSVLSTADRPYTALLWIEFQISPMGQKLIDEYHPYGASIFIPGTAQEKATRGKQLSVVDWEHLIKLKDYQAKVVEAYGFPKAATR